MRLVIVSILGSNLEFWEILYNVFAILVKINILTLHFRPYVHNCNLLKGKNPDIRLGNVRLRQNWGSSTINHEVNSLSNSFLNIVNYFGTIVSNLALFEPLGTTLGKLRTFCISKSEIMNVLLHSESYFSETSCTM